MRFKVQHYLMAIVISSMVQLHSSESFAQVTTELSKDASVLGFHLGMSSKEVQDWFSDNKSDYPNIKLSFLSIQMTGIEKYDGVITARSKNGKIEEDFLFQFSPPFDGEKLIGLVRSVNYGLDAGTGPQVRDLEQALFERYGAFPSETFLGHNMFWARDSSLSQEEELKQCTYPNMITYQSILQGSPGCGLTLDVEINNNSSHPGFVFIYQAALWDQSRIASNQQKALEIGRTIEAAKAREADKNRAQQGPAASPKL